MALDDLKLPAEVSEKTEGIAEQFLKLKDTSKLFYAEYCLEDGEYYAEVVFNDKHGITGYMKLQVSSVLVDFAMYLLTNGLDVTQSPITIRKVMNDFIASAIEDHLDGCAENEGLYGEDLTDHILAVFSSYIAVDLDETICASGGLSDKHDFVNAKPIQEAVEYVRTLHSQGIGVVIHTARPFRDYKVTVEWLRKHGVPFTFISMAKLKASIYIDDRSINPKIVSFDKIPNIVKVVP